MSEVIIRIAGDDITEHVIYDDAEFTSAAKGRAGTARFRIKDIDHEYAFSTGDTLTLDIDGLRKWDGFVGKIERGYFFEADCTCRVPLTPRYLLIDGVDDNVLLQKRVLYDKVDITNMELTRFNTGTADSSVLLYYLTNHTDLLSDGVTTNLIETVGTPFVDDPVSGSASWTVDNFLRYLTSETGAIYYIDPDKALVLTDVDTPNAPFGISDDPISGEVGCRDLEIDFDGSGLRNDALAWGVGQGNPNPVFSRVTDAASVAEHGLWQVGDFNPSIWHQSTIDRVADSYVYGSPQNRRGGKDDRTSVKCTVFQPDFRVAQKVTLRSDTFDFEDVIPIRSETITFDTKTDPRYTLVLAHDIDDPWTTIEFWFPDWRLPDFDFNLNLPDLDLGLPPNDPCGHKPCIDTFTRTVSGGLGNSEFGGYAWALSSGSSTNTSVTGTEAKLSSPSGSFNGGTFHLEGASLQFHEPIEILVKMRLAREAARTIVAGANFAALRLFVSPQEKTGGLGPPTNGQHQGIEVAWTTADPAGLGNLAYPDVILFQTRSNPTSTTYTPDAVSTVVMDEDEIDIQEVLYVRWRLDGDGMHGRIWNETQPEPDDWTIETDYTHDDTVSYRNHLWLQYVSNATQNVYIDQLWIVRGLNCFGDNILLSPTAYSPVCSDTFSRTERNGWGTGEWGIPWQYDISSGVGVGDPSRIMLGLSVDGDRGIWDHLMTQPGVPIDTSVYPFVAGTWTLPAEVTVAGAYLDRAGYEAAYHTADTTNIGDGTLVHNHNPVFVDRYRFKWRWDFGDYSIGFYARPRFPTTNEAQWQAWLFTEGIGAVVTSYYQAPTAFTPTEPAPSGAYLLNTWNVPKATFDYWRTNLPAPPGGLEENTSGWYDSVPFEWGFQLRIESNQVLARAWGPDGQNSASYTAVFPLTPDAPTTLGVSNEHTDVTRIYVDNIFTSGMDCAPCNTISGSDAPCNGRRLCETSTTTDGGTTYLTNHQWSPGSDEVWVDGIRIDYRDYTPVPELRFIILNTPVDPDEVTVRICYTATCIGED